MATLREHPTKRAEKAFMRDGVLFLKLSNEWLQVEGGTEFERKLVKEVTLRDKIFMPYLSAVCAMVY